MIQYIHRNVQIQKGFKKTFAFKAPSAADMFKGIEKKLKGKEAFLKLEVGISHVHWKDKKDLLEKYLLLQTFFFQKIQQKLT